MNCVDIWRSVICSRLNNVRGESLWKKEVMSGLRNGEEQKV